MKKLLSLMMTILLAAGLTACTGGGTSSGGDTASDPVTSDLGTPDPGGTDGGGKLTVWCWDPAFNIYAMEEAGKVYQADHPDFQVEIIETPWEDLQTKLITIATSNDFKSLPDIFLCQNNAFQKNFANYPDLFTDLTDSDIAFKDFPESVLAYSTVDEHHYGVPFDNGTAILALRTDVLEEAGYTIEDFTDIDWDTFIQQGKTVLEKTGKPMISSTAGESDLVVMMLQSTGSSLFADDGSLHILDNPELKDAMSTYLEMVEAGILVEINNWDEYIGTFIDSKVAGTINGCWILASVQTAEDQSGLWDITNVPKFNSPNATNYTANGGSSWAISSNCADVPLAQDFLGSTFAGSVPFYETILSSSGAIANYIPAGESDVYKEPQPYFNDSPIYATVVEYGASVPSNNTGVYYYEARDAIGVAITQIIQGTDIDTAIQEAHDTVTFDMGG